MEHLGPDGKTSSITKFLALDKPQDRPSNESRRLAFIEFVDIPTAGDEPLELCYDPHWLAILKNTDHLAEISSKVRVVRGVMNRAVN